MKDITQAFKLAWKGKHIKAAKFLINSDSSSILLGEEDMKLIAEWGLDLCADAIKANLKIKRHRLSMMRNILNLLKRNEEKVNTL